MFCDHRQLRRQNKTSAISLSSHYVIYRRFYSEKQRMQPVKKKSLPQQFKPGQSGNPGGRPRGSRNKATALSSAAADVLTGDDYRAIVLKMAKMARAGDVQAAKLLMPRWKSVVKPVRFDMDVSDPLTAAKDVANAIARGELPPDVGAMLISALAGLNTIADVQELRPLLMEWKEQQERNL